MKNVNINIVVMPQPMMDDQDQILNETNYVFISS